MIVKNLKPSTAEGTNENNLDIQVDTIEKNDDENDVIENDSGQNTKEQQKQKKVRNNIFKEDVNSKSYTYSKEKDTRSSNYHPTLQSKENLSPTFSMEDARENRKGTEDSISSPEDSMEVNVQKMDLSERKHSNVPHQIEKELMLQHQGISHDRKPEEGMRKPVEIGKMGSHHKMNRYFDKNKHLARNNKAQNEYAQMQKSSWIAHRLAKKAKEPTERMIMRNKNFLNKGYEKHKTNLNDDPRQIVKDSKISLNHHDLDGNKKETKFHSSAASNQTKKSSSHQTRASRHQDYNGRQSFTRSSAHRAHSHSSRSSGRKHAFHRHESSSRMNKLKLHTPFAESARGLLLDKHIVIN